MVGIIRGKIRLGPEDGWDERQQCEMASRPNRMQWGENRVTMNSERYCAIWPEYRIDDYQSRALEDESYFDSPRAGGPYTIDRYSIRDLKNLGNDIEAQRFRARLTTMLVEMRRQGEEWPNVNRDLIRAANSRRGLHPYERATRLLRYFAEIPSRLGDGWHLDDNEVVEAMVLTESVDHHEIGFLIRYLDSQGLVAKTVSMNDDLLGARVTLDGHARVADSSQAGDPGQAFVAMWFHDEVTPLYIDGLRPAIRKAGYREFRIDEKPDADKIDDEIIAEIRRSRFVVADLTYGEMGARGGVYYEAGFAYGLGIPVIYTCRKDLIDEVQFDTRQFSHILWENPEEIVEPLKHRILARIGEGPHGAWG